MLIFRRYYHDRYREAVITGKAPIGGSAGKEPGERTQGPYTAADPGGCDFGESLSAGQSDEFGRFGERTMQSYGTELKSENAPGNRSVFLLSRRAHLLTTCDASGGIPNGPCALRGGCGSCGNLRTRRSAMLSSAQLADAVQGSLRQLSAKNFPRKLLRCYGSAVCRPIFFLRKRNKNERTV